VTSLPADLATLVDDLRSPDPVVRDRGAYSALANRAEEGSLDDHLPALAERAVALLADEAVQARSFGALLAALVVDRDNVTGRAGEDVVRRLLDVLRRWYVAEPDTRAAPDGPVRHPAVRAAALTALGGALAELHWFYGRPA